MSRWLSCLTALLVALPLSAQEIVRNASFEIADDDGRPEAWTGVVWGGADTEPSVCTVVARDDAPEGRYVAQTRPTAPICAAWAQQLDNLEPGRWYEASVALKCEDLVGHGCHLNLEYWRGEIGYGCVDAEHLVGTHDWTRQTVRFLAPGPDYWMKLSLFQIGGPGTVWFDDVTVRPIDPPDPDLSQRRVLEQPFWGMFTCFARYLHEYGELMRDLGVHWQRQGLSSTAPEQQQVAERLGMSFQTCIDGMPLATDPQDPCFPTTDTEAYLDFLNPFLEAAGPSIKCWEFFNEPNTHLGWSLPGYANLITRVGPAIKARHPEALIATGGFALPGVGYAEACLKRDPDRVIDLVLLHPYAVDEALDATLVGMAEAAARAGRPDVAVAINETGFATWDPATGCESYEMFVPEDVQAQHVVKVHIQALAHRLSFVTYLAFNDITEPSDHARNMGLLRVDGSPKPSFSAYAYMTSTIGDRKVADWSYGADGTRVYRFEGARPLWVAWNALRESELVLDVGEQTVMPRNMYGAGLCALPQTGKLSLSVGTEPIYITAP